TFYEMLIGAPPFTSADPLEIVHAHLARLPSAPAVVRPQLPRLLSDLIVKLLAKMPEWRYQTAEALHADLVEARRQWKSCGRIDSFQLARLDRRELIVPSQLFGREHETEELHTALARAAVGANELVVIKGKAGIGKTALVEKLWSCLEAPCSVVAGKCNQL